MQQRAAAVGRVFLDVDGVVCLFSVGLSAAPLDALAELLGRALAELGLELELVISSTWRTQPRKLKQLAAAFARQPGLPAFDPAAVASEAQALAHDTYSHFLPALFPGPARAVLQLTCGGVAACQEPLCTVTAGSRSTPSALQK